MLTTSVGIHSVRVELFENERYSPIAGWSAKALLPTERSAFSSADGVDGFASLEEANAALLPRGWCWETEGGWMMDTGLPNADKEGWSFSTDFSSFGDSDKTGSATKGILHFVRRRKLIRDQYFDGEHLTLAACCLADLCLLVANLCDMGEVTCDHCDLQEVERLAELFLEKLVAASLRRHPRRISQSKVVALKSALVDILVSFSFSPKAGATEEDGSGSTSRSTLSRISSGFRNLRSSSISAPAAAVPGAANECAPAEWKSEVEIAQTYNLSTLMGLLDQFAEHSQTAWSMASSVLKAGDPMTNLSERMQEISQNYFMLEERMELARFVLRAHDHASEFHCNQKNCGNHCIFTVEPCPNMPCAVCFSRKWAAQHDGLCPEKLLPCERVCGETVARKRMFVHLEEHCCLRPVTCPFTCIGCTADLLAKDLDGHVQQQTALHLQLLLGRHLEHQKVLSSVYQSVQDLETSHQQHVSLLTTLQTAHAATTVALAVSEKRQEKHVQSQISALDSKLSKSISNVQAEMQGEFGKVRKAFTDMRK